MQLPFSYSKYSQFKSCPIKYFHAYVLKTKVEEEMSYALVLGSLVHLFIELYNNNIYTIKEIRELKDNLKNLYKFITITYPAICGASNFEYKTITIKSNVDKIIDFIEENNVVFYHALKLFNIYLDNIFLKFTNINYETELKFNNIIKLKEDVVCFYGSIDFIFYQADKHLKYFYLTDFKTGKKLYSTYIDQLYFYYWNLLNYSESGDMLNNIDNIKLLSYLAKSLDGCDKTYFILWQLRDNIFEKYSINEHMHNIENYMGNMLSEISNDIIPLHKGKSNITFDRIYEKYKDKFNIELKDEIIKESFACKFCKFSSLCNYRIGE